MKFITFFIAVSCLCAIAQAQKGGDTLLSANRVSPLRRTWKVRNEPAPVAVRGVVLQQGPSRNVALNEESYVLAGQEPAEIRQEEEVVRKAPRVVKQQKAVVRQVPTVVKQQPEVVRKAPAAVKKQSVSVVKTSVARSVALKPKPQKVSLVRVTEAPVLEESPVAEVASPVAEVASPVVEVASPVVEETPLVDVANPLNTDVVDVVGTNAEEAPVDVASPVVEDASPVVEETPAVDVANPVANTDVVDVVGTNAEEAPVNVASSVVEEAPVVNVVRTAAAPRRNVQVTPVNARRTVVSPVVELSYSKVRRPQLKARRPVQVVVVSQEQVEQGADDTEEDLPNSVPQVQTEVRTPVRRVVQVNQQPAKLQAPQNTRRKFNVLLRTADGFDEKAGYSVTSRRSAVVN